MFRLRVFLFLILFITAFVGKGFRPLVGESPFRSAQSFSESAPSTVDETAAEDDTYGPMKPFKAKRRAQASALQLAAFSPALSHASNFIAKLHLPTIPALTSRCAAPELRPPITRA
jgi:hypothetical protein